MPIRPLVLIVRSATDSSFISSLRRIKRANITDFH
jgi:hypothetical protein